MKRDRQTSHSGLCALAAAAVIALGCGTEVAAQNSTASPYSIYGVGVLTPKEDAAAAALGHSGIALSPSEWVNISNPAGIGNLDSLSFYFNFGLKGHKTHLRSGYERSTTYSANVDGISMAFRGRKWLAIAFGYAPFSAVGYKLRQTKNIYGSTDYYNVTFTGSGGLSQAYFNAAFSPFKHWTIGGNFSVLWGTIEKLEVSYFSEVNGGEDIYNKRKYQANNIYWEVGTQFDFNLGENNFRFGATYAPKIWMHTSYDQTIYNDVSRELDSDASTPERFHIPRMYGAGFAFTRHKILGTVEYKVAEWGSVTDTKFRDNATLRDTYTISGGLQYSPGHPDDPFYKRMRYRVGYYYGRDYVDLQSINLLQKGFTLGMTIPMGRSRNGVTISYEHQTRGTENNGNIKETVNSLKVSISIREIWFMRHKFD